MACRARPSDSCVGEHGVHGEHALERRDAARAELAACGPPQLGERVLGRAGAAVDAGREHRVERVGDVDDPRAERDVLPAQPVRVAGAVEALVVVLDRRHGVAEEAEPVDDPRALLRVVLHERPLQPGERRRLEEDRVRDRELADVVEERRVTEQVELGLREADLPADRERELLDAA